MKYSYKAIYKGIYGYDDMNDLLKSMWAIFWNRIHSIPLMNLMRLQSYTWYERMRSQMTWEIPE